MDRSPIDLFCSDPAMETRELEPPRMDPADFLPPRPEGRLTLDQAVRSLEPEYARMIDAQMAANREWARRFFMAEAEPAELERQALYLKWMKTKKPPFVYFLRAGPFVKIGTAVDPMTRIASIKTSLPVEPVIAGLMMGDRKVEGDQHNKFYNSRIRGEWFVWSEQIRAYLYLRHCRYFGKELPWK